jgi:adenine-specific DNA-methyltransferase
MEQYKISDLKEPSSVCLKAHSVSNLKAHPVSNLKAHSVSDLKAHPVSNLKAHSVSDLKSLSIGDLKNLCKQKGIRGYHSKSKAELITLLSNEDSEYDKFVYQPMITYIGNKRKLVPWICNIIKEIALELGKGKISIFDGFAGSGVVSRAVLQYSSELYTNDIEYYSYIILSGIINKPTSAQQIEINKHINKMNRIVADGELMSGFITSLYAPADTNNIREGERCFYTHENAMRIDTMRNYIAKHVSADILPYCLAPLLIKASINVNTAGVFRGFYKQDGKGCFGGAGRNALERILKPIELEEPVWSNSDADVVCMNSDIFDAIAQLPVGGVDLIYLDPPYNEHPYGSNYFMLNLIARGEAPVDISEVSGIPREWNKSDFNGRGSALSSMDRLIGSCKGKAKYVLLSYNNEGLVTEEQWRGLFKKHGFSVKKYERSYDTYHGSRNLGNRAKKVTEIMYLLQTAT